MTNPAAAPTATARSRNWLTWLVLFVPFVITVIVGGPASGRLMPHGIYHIVYIAVIAAAIVVLWKWRATSSSTAVRGLATGIIVLQVIALVGHIGEWISTLSDGQFLDGTTVVDGNEDLHTFFANITVPALVLSIVALIPLTVIAVRHSHRDAATDSADHPLVQQPYNTTSTDDRPS